jgi:hypothetical protein
LIFWFVLSRQNEQKKHNKKDVFFFSLFCLPRERIKKPFLAGYFETKMVLTPFAKLRGKRVALP